MYDVGWEHSLRLLPFARMISEQSGLFVVIGLASLGLYLLPYKHVFVFFINARCVRTK